MTSIGETLRRERLRLGLDLDEIAQATKIGSRLLEAMEANEFDKLPGGVFTRSFIRQCARALGLDDDSLRAELDSLEAAQAASSGNDEPPFQPDRGNIFDRMGRPSSNPDRTHPLTSATIWLLVIGAFVGGYYLVKRRHVNPPSDLIQTRPAKPTTDPLLKPPVSTPPAAAIPAQPPGATSAGGGSVQMTLTASQPTWVSIKSDGKEAFVGVLQANESKRIGAAKIIRLVAGNAGGLEVSLNGRPVGPLGPKGQVRVVELTSGGVRAVPRAPSASPL